MVKQAMPGDFGSSGELPLAPIAEVEMVDPEPIPSKSIEFLHSLTLIEQGYLRSIIVSGGYIHPIYSKSWIQAPGSIFQRHVSIPHSDGATR